MLPPISREEQELPKKLYAKWKPRWDRFSTWYGWAKWVLWTLPMFFTSKYEWIIDHLSVIFFGIVLICISILIVIFAIYYSLESEEDEVEEYLPKTSLLPPPPQPQPSLLPTPTPPTSLLPTPTPSPRTSKSKLKPYEHHQPINSICHGSIIKLVKQ